MSKRGGRSNSRAGSVKSTGKAPGGKKPETCSLCTKPDKNLRLLNCNHNFCPNCLKTLPKIDQDPNEKDGKTSKMSNRGGRKSTTPRENYVCPICNKPPEPDSTKTIGECAPCKFQEKSSPAHGFCLECSELLCETCCTEHIKFKTIRAHHILTGDKIPKDTGAIARLPLLMMCMVHTEKDLEYYCADHDVMACGACVNTDHRRCERVMFIKDITDAPTDRKAVADAACELRDIRKNFEDIHKDTGEILASLEQQRNEIRERRDQYKNRIMSLLDKLDTSSELEMEEVLKNVSKDMGDDSQSSKEILTHIDSSIQILDAAASHATDIQLFVAGRRSTADRDKYFNMLNTAMGSIQNVRLEFKPDPTLERLAKSLEMFDGRCITSNSTRYNQKAKNSLQPQNGYIDHNDMQNNNYISRNGMRRSGSEYSTSQHPMSDSLPVIGKGSVMSGSVADFGSSGYRSTSLADFNSLRSQPQSPRRYDYGQQYQTRSMPPTPILPEINRSQLVRANTGLGTTQYERQMFSQGALPLISPRNLQYEQDYDMVHGSGQQRDFVPVSPRTVGNNSLINQGLSLPPVQRSDVLTVTHPGISRRTSSVGQSSLPVSTRELSKVAARSDILAQASPIKLRSELTPEKTAYRERIAVLAGQFNVRLPEDQNACSLKGTALMDDGRIVLADYDNHNVKLFDSKLYRGSRLSLSSGPWDIEVTGPKEVAVTLPFESKIQFIAVTDQLKTTRTIKMEMDCYGLVCRNQELVVVCNDYLIGPAVQIVSMTGRVKQTIDTDRSGRRILTDPYYLTVTPTGKQIYVADKDRIVCMDRHGNVTSIYEDPSLRNTRGIDMDNEGNLYVCGYMSNNVLQITMHGIDFRCLINKEQIWDPWSIKFNETNGTIVVTCDASDIIKVFSLQ